MPVYIYMAKGLLKPLVILPAAIMSFTSFIIFSHNVIVSLFLLIYLFCTTHSIPFTSYKSFSLLITFVSLHLTRLGNFFYSWQDNCECASCYACANLPRTIPKSYWSWPVANRKESVPTCTVVSSNTVGVHVPRCLYACPIKTEVPD